LLLATERDLAKVAAATTRKTKPLRGAAEIGLAVGAVRDKHKMAKHFELTITDAHFAYCRKSRQIAEEAALDGLYAVRTSLPEQTLADAATVRAYKSLAMVERAFRCLKTVDLHVRPIHHWLEDRVRAHVFLCMLAYYVEWNLRAKLAPMLYDDDDRQAAEALRDSPVAKAQRSPSALAKSATGLAADGVPVHSFQSLLADLATLARNTIVTAIAPDKPFTVLTRPTPIQQKAFDLLAIPVACTQ
jgi:transposase